MQEFFNVDIEVSKPTKKYYELDRLLKYLRINIDQTRYIKNQHKICNDFRVLGVAYLHKKTACLRYIILLVQLSTTFKKISSFLRNWNGEYKKAANGVNLIGFPGIFCYGLLDDYRNYRKYRYRWDAMIYGYNKKKRILTEYEEIQPHEEDLTFLYDLDVITKSGYSKTIRDLNVPNYGLIFCY